MRACVFWEENILNLYFLKSLSRGVIIMTFCFERTDIISTIKFLTNENQNSFSYSH